MGDGFPASHPGSSLTRKDAPVSNRIESEVRVFSCTLGRRDRHSHEAKRALTCLRSLGARTLIKRQPERRSEGEDGNRHHE
jgi:hypothetical protein